MLLLAYSCVIRHNFYYLIFIQNFIYKYRYLSIIFEKTHNGYILLKAIKNKLFLWETPLLHIKADERVKIASQRGYVRVFSGNNDSGMIFI